MTAAMAIASDHVRHLRATTDAFRSVPPRLLPDREPRSEL
jgi:hypothetical protein